MSYYQHRRINILFLIVGYRSLFGGGKRVFMQIMKGLSKSRFNVYASCSLDIAHEEELAAANVKVFNSHITRTNPIRSIVKLACLMRRENIEIVHSQGGRADIYSRLAASIAKVPVVINTTTMVVEGYDVMFLKKLFYVLCDRTTERFVDKFIVVSEGVRQILLKHKDITPEKIIKIYNGIELDQYEPVDEREDKVRTGLGIGNDECLVGTVGRLVYQKGFEFLLRAAANILQSVPKTRFIFIGDGPLKAKLEALGEELGIVEKCMFVGFRDDIRDLLSSLDVFVLPSIVEGHPIAILEAMAMAKPIVASDIDGIREQIESGRTGVLVPPGDPQALGEAITQMLKDRQRARELGMEARKQAEEVFDLRRQVALYEQVYKELAKEKELPVLSDG